MSGKSLQALRENLRKNAEMAAAAATSPALKVPPVKVGKGKEKANAGTGTKPSVEEVTVTKEIVTV